MFLLRPVTEYYKPAVLKQPLQIDKTHYYKVRAAGVTGRTDGPAACDIIMFLCFNAFCHKEILDENERYSFAAFFVL